MFCVHFKRGSKLEKKDERQSSYRYFWIETSRPEDDQKEQPKKKTNSIRSMLRFNKRNVKQHKTSSWASESELNLGGLLSSMSLKRFSSTDSDLLLFLRD